MWEKDYSIGTHEELIYKMVEAHINPKLLRWARERSSLTYTQLAKKTHIKPEYVVSWENGETYPTFSKARELAKKLYIPFGYLFLSVPPDEKPIIPDLRTINDIEFNATSLDLFNDVMYKQQWYREYLLDENSERLKFIGKYNIQDNIKVVATAIAKHLNINDDFRQKASNWELFLRNFIKQAEDNRILVLRSSIFKNNVYRPLLVEQFRGFVICDDFAPLIFINGNDSKVAQIFTLAHELAHLWIGESGISNPDISRKSFNIDKNIEKFCNNVAAELLVPGNEFLTIWGNNKTTNDNIHNLAHRYRVSSLVILRRAYDLNKISWDEYSFLYKNEIANFEERKKYINVRSSGGDFYANIGVRNSPRLIKALVGATFEGRLMYHEAARMLGVKVKTLNNIAENFDIR